MGWKRKRSGFSSHERVTLLLRTATVQNSQEAGPENDDSCSIVRNAPKNGTPTFAANTHQERSKISRVVVQPRKRNAERYDSQNGRDFQTSRMRNAKNNAIPANENYRNKQQVQKRIHSVIVQPLIQVEVWTKHGIRFSRVKSDKNSPSAFKLDSNAQRMLSKSTNKESECQSEISEGYGYRNRQNLRISRLRCPRSDSSSVVSLAINNMKAVRRSSIEKGETLSEIVNEYKYQNEHNLRACRKIYPRIDSSTVTTHDANTVQAGSKSVCVKGKTLGETTGKYQLDSHCSTMKNSRNFSPTVIAEDLSTQKASSTFAHVENRFPNEIEEGYESSTENRIRFSRLRNERDNTSVTITQKPHVQHITNISSSTKNRSLREALEKYKCSICLDTRHRRAIRYLPCHHRFHKKCIHKWLNENEICPICQFGY